MDVLFRYAHFLGIILMAGTLMTEVLLVKRKMSGYEIRKVGLVDAAYGMAGVMLITAGLLLWFKGQKPAFFYTQNPVFLAKLGLVGTTALLSVWPTVWFITKRKTPDTQQIPVPDSVRFIVRAELAIVLAIPLLAVLMARGIGMR